LCGCSLVWRFSLTPQELFDRRAGDDEAYRIERRQTIRDDLTRRLRSVCTNFSDEDFLSLVEIMTDNKIRGEQRGST
jgi:hypothetical protein